MEPAAEDVVLPMTNLQPSSPQSSTPEFLQLILPDRLSNSAAGVVLHPDFCQQKTRTSGFHMGTQASHRCPCANLGLSENKAAITMPNESQLPPTQNSEWGVGYHIPERR